MTSEELKMIVRYINDTIKECISTDFSETNDAIEKGFFNEKEFVDYGIVKLDD